MRRGVSDFVGDRPGDEVTMHAHSLGNDALALLVELRKRGWRFDRSCHDAEWRHRAEQLINAVAELKAREDVKYGGGAA